MDDEVEITVFERVHFGNGSYAAVQTFYRCPKCRALLEPKAEEAEAHWEALHNA